MAIAIGVGWILLTSLVLAALNGIFQTALYRYAAGMGTGAFDGNLGTVFAPKAPRGFGG